MLDHPLYFIAFVNQIQISKELYIDIEVTALLIVASIIDLLFKTFIIWNNIFLAIVWIDEFGIKCENNKNTDMISHTKYCLKNYESLKKSLGRLKI